MLTRRKFLLLAATAGSAGLLAACGGGGNTGSSAAPAATKPAADAAPTQAPAAPAAEATKAPATDAGAAGAEVDKSKLAKELALWTFGNYLSEEVVKKFKDEFGVSLKYDTFSANEEAEAKFKAGGNPGYDVLIISDYMVSKFAGQNLLEPLDKAIVTNMKNIDPGLQGLYYDKNNEYSAGYFWGTTGVAYESSKVKEPITSWKQVMEPSDDIKGKIGMLDDMRELLGVGLRYKGFSANTSKPEEIEAAKKALIDQKKSVKVYADSPTSSTNLSSGDVIVTMIYTNDAMLAIRNNPNIKYVIPADVSTVWQDNMVIPKGAPSVYTAQVFINFMLRPDIAAQNANDVGSGSPNAEAVKQGLIDKALTSDPTIYPDIKGLGNKVEWLVKGDPAVDELYQRAFDEIKNS